MMGILKIPFLLMLVLGVVIAAYLYVSRAEDVTQIKNEAGNTIQQAEDVKNQADQNAQRLQDAQNQLSQ